MMVSGIRKKKTSKKMTKSITKSITKGIAKTMLSVLLLVVLILSGCAGTLGGQEPPAPELVPDESERLVIYTSHKENVWWPIVKEFEERTGIWVEVVEGGTNELLDRLRKEADEPAADIMFGGGAESLDACQDLFEAYRCAAADKLDPRFCEDSWRWTPFSALPEVLIYNTKLVGEGELSGWADLAGENYAGQIAFADPAVSGSAFTGLVTYLKALEEDSAGSAGDAEGAGSVEGAGIAGTEAGFSEDDTERIRTLAYNLQGRQLAGSGDVLSEVAAGHFQVGVTLEESGLKLIREGANVGIVYPAEGTSAVPDGTAIVAGAPHAENAKRFLEFTVSRDVQELLAREFYRRPVRTDVAVSPDLPSWEDFGLIAYDVGQVSADRDRILAEWERYLDEAFMDSGPAGEAEQE